MNTFFLILYAALAAYGVLSLLHELWRKLCRTALCDGRPVYLVAASAEPFDENAARTLATLCEGEPYTPLVLCRDGRECEIAGVAAVDLGEFQNLLFGCEKIGGIS